MLIPILGNKRRSDPDPDAVGGAMWRDGAAMLCAMTIQRLQEAHHAQPFRPFTIRMADGRGLLVRHPDYLAHTPAGRTAVVLRDDESCSIIDLLLATELEFHGPNGSAEEAA